MGQLVVVASPRGLAAGQRGGGTVPPSLAAGDTVRVAK
jgi:hypothetical protein